MIESGLLFLIKRNHVQQNSPNPNSQKNSKNSNSKIFFGVEGNFLTEKKFQKDVYAFIPEISTINRDQAHMQISSFNEHVQNSIYF